MNKWKDEFATERDCRILKEALVGADVFIGVSSKNLLNAEDVSKMAARPIIFAMANPVPEIYPDEARKGHPDAIIATGRSDFPNQINTANLVTEGGVFYWPIVFFKENQVVLLL